MPQVVGPRRCSRNHRLPLLFLLAGALSPLACVGEGSPSSSTGGGDATGAEFYPPSEFQDVFELTEETFNALVKPAIDITGGRVFHVLHLYYGKNVKGKENEFKKSVDMRPKIVQAAKKLRSSAVMVSGVDVSDLSMEEFLAKEGIEMSGSPTVVIFTPEGDREIFEDKPSNLAQYMTEKIKKYVSDDLTKYMPLLAPKQKTYKSFKKDKSLPRVVMILEAKKKSKKKEQLYDAISNLSVHYHGRLSFGYSKHRKIAKTFGANELPALFLIPAGMKFDSARPYTGTFAYRPLKTWLAQYLGGESQVPSALPPAKSIEFIPEINSNECLQKYCVSRGGICTMILLPQTLPEGEREYYLESMKLVRRALADKLGLTSLNAIHFVSLDSLKYSDWLEINFGLPAAEYARAIVWYPKKQAWSQYVGRFNAPEVSKWITLASKGKATAEPINVSEVKALEAHGEMDSSEDACSSLNDPLPDAVLPDSFKERMKTKKRGPKSKPSPPKMENYNSNRLPRPRSKAGKSFTLDSKIFKENVIDSPSHWLVWFQNEEPSEEKAAAWTKSARSLKGMVQFGVVAPEKRESLMEEFSIPADDEGESQIRLFPAKHLWAEGAESKLEESSWLDSQLESEELTKKALSLLSDSTGIFMIDSRDQSKSLESWMQSKPQAPRMVLFPSKDLEEPPFLMKALMVEFGNIIEFGVAMNSDVAFSKSLQIQKFPSIVIFAPQAPPGPDGKVQIGLIPYMGHVSFNAIAIYLESNIRVAPPQEATKDVKDEL